MRIGLIVAAIVAILSLPLSAQSPPPRRFDVIVIEPSTSESWDMAMSMRDGTLRITNLFLKSIITSAYGIREDLISGLPSRAQSARFDIVAKLDEPDTASFNNMSRTQRREMIAALLADRFHLKAHTQSRILPIYELVPAKGGVRFPQHTPATESTPSSMGDVKVHKGEFNATGAPMPILSSFLAETIESTVIDSTGLAGKYDFHLKWASDEASDGPSLFTALQEQLGLKLLPGKGPVDTLIVDRIERPSEN
jgi:uncharacterized protein (TIGR03435 family)